MSATTGMRAASHPPGFDRALVAQVAEAADVHLGRGSWSSVGGGRRLSARTPDRTRVLVRIGRFGSPGDPRPGAAFLDELGPSPVRPRIRGTGVVGAYGWSVEELLPGRAPRRIDTRLVAQVEDHLASLPRSDGSPTGPGRDLRLLALALPRWQPRLLDLASQVDDALTEVPAVVAHGDLWSGNLLARGGRLTGIVDWDAARFDGAPGQDVLHLLALARRRTTREGLGDIVAADPWRWAAVERSIAGATPTGHVDEQLGRAVTLAWWAAHVAGTLTRVPARAGDEMWLQRHVSSVLSASDD